jgi:hypothetical protein
VLGASESTAILIGRLVTLRGDEKVNSLIQQTNEAVERYGLEMPSADRVRKTTARYRHTDHPESVPENVPTTETWRRNYFEALDIVINELRRRFDQPGMKIAAQREQLLVDAATRSTISEPDMPPLPLSIDQRRLSVQLSMLHDLCSDKQVANIQALAAIVASAQPETRRVFREVEQLLTLCLSLPTSVAGSERSFSGLRRLKSWMRSTMTQTRLTSLALMNVHCDILDQLDIDVLVKEFCAKTPERRSVFGC